MKKKRVRPSPAQNPQPRPPVFSVRPNPAHYLVSFQPGSTSPEQLVVSLLFENDRRLVCLVGLPGSGKTVALRSVAHYAAVHAHFRDGIALLGLAPSTTPASLLADLCELVARIAGEAPKRDIEQQLASSNSHIGAIDAVANALRHRRVLLILDNVGNSPGVVLELLQRLTHVAMTSASLPPKDKTSRLAILASTRSVLVARKIGGTSLVHVDFLDPLGSTARDMLCAHLGLPRAELDAYCAVPVAGEAPAKVVLRRCAGLPLAVAVAGGALKRLLVQDRNRESIWAHYSEYLTKNFEQFGHISRLFSNFAACVDAIEKWPLIMPVQNALAVLVSLPSEIGVSKEKLQKLWGASTEGEVLAAIDELANQCLVKRIMRDGKVLGMKIPSIIMDFCRHEAKNLTKLKPASTAGFQPVAAKKAGGGSANEKAKPRTKRGRPPGVRASAKIRKTTAKGNGAAAVAAERMAQGKRQTAAEPGDSLMSHFSGTAAVFQTSEAERDKES